MLYLITGVPGSGKTLLMMSMLKKRKDLQDHPLYLDGIPNVDRDKIPYIDIPEGCSVENWHEWLPPNAILVVDESQRHFRPRANGSKVPPHVAELETHRHKGVDIFLLTQHPRLVDINVKSFVENHKHISKSQLGTRRIWEWQRAGNPDSKGDIKDALTRTYKLDSSAYNLYKSAEVHTKIKVGRSKWIWFFPVLLFAIGGLIWWTYNYIDSTIGNTDKKPHQSVQAVSDVQTASSPTTGRYETTQNDTTIKVEDYKPVLDGKPWTAPIYKDMNQKIQSMPFPVACIKTSRKCTCYTDQATPIRDLDNGICLDFAENGIYNPYLNGGDQPKVSVQPPT